MKNNVKEFKFVEVMSILNKDRVNTNDVTIISDSLLADMIRDRIFKLHSSYNGTVEMLDEISLTTRPLTDLINKRIAICTTSMDIDKVGKLKTMSKILQKMNLPEFCEFEIKYERA